jgi:hypothetical protein
MNPFLAALDATTASVIVGCVFVVGAVIIATRFTGKSKTHVRGPFGTSIEVQGENPPPPSEVPKGVSVKGKAGRDIVAHSASEGGVSVDAEAEGHIKATHTPGQPTPPKP